MRDENTKRYVLTIAGETGDLGAIWLFAADDSAAIDAAKARINRRWDFFGLHDHGAEAVNYHLLFDDGNLKEPAFDARRAALRESDEATDAHWADALDQVGARVVRAFEVVCGRNHGEVDIVRESASGSARTWALPTPVQDHPFVNSSSGREARRKARLGQRPGR